MYKSVLLFMSPLGCCCAPEAAGLLPDGSRCTLLGSGWLTLLVRSVEDGWEPLCRFLGKEVPSVPFPNGNPPKAWAERIAVTTAGYHAKAVRNMIVFGAVVVVVVGLLAAKVGGCL